MEYNVFLIDALNNILDKHEVMQSVTTTVEYRICLMCFILLYPSQNPNVEILILKVKLLEDEDGGKVIRTYQFYSHRWN